MPDDDDLLPGSDVAGSETDPLLQHNTADPGDETARNFRYQYAYGVMLLVAARRGVRPYVALWCEHHEDFLAERSDRRLDAYQIKTRRPELGPWTLTTEALVRSIGRFVELAATLGDRVVRFAFVSNAQFGNAASDIKDKKHFGRCPIPFLAHVKGCTSYADLAEPFLSVFKQLQASCGCEAEVLLAVLQRVDLINGPSRGEFDASLSHEHLGRLEECAHLAPADLDSFRDRLVDQVARASSLQVIDPMRHLRSLIGAQEPDPAMAAKRISLEMVCWTSPAPPPEPFKFPGHATLALGSGVAGSVIRQKLEAAGLEDQVDYLSDRARAAEYNLMLDAVRRPESFGELLTQIEQRVLGEVSEAHLRARRGPTPYGPEMLIEVQDRLRRLTEREGEAVGHHKYDCLIGVAGLLRSECRVWWGPRFIIREDGP
jgi:hypothetical protein